MSNAPLVAKIKRHFFTLLLGVHLLLIVVAIVRIFTGGGFGWLGLLLPPFALFGFVTWLMRSDSARTSANLPWVIGLSAAGVLLAFSAGGVALLLAIVGLLSNLVYIFWYSRFGRRPSDALAAGKMLPAFSLEDSDGNPIQSEQFRGKPTILLFFRGNWCPLCVAQIQELAARYRELDERGAQVVLISPQSHENTQELASRFDVPMQFLVDPHNQAAEQLGIMHELGVPTAVKGYDPDTVLPTVVVTDAQGIILYSDQTDNYRVRPEPSTFLRVLDAAA